MRSSFLWVIFHAAIVALALCFSPLKINQDLFSVLPDSTGLREISAAEKELSSRTMSQINLFVGHKDFAVARAAADSLGAAFAKDSSFESFRLTIDGNDLSKSREFIYKHRFSLQGKDFAQELSQGSSALEEEALQRAFGAFTIADLSNVEEDPFLLGERAFDRMTIHSPLIPKNLTIKDGYLVANDKKSFIFISATLSKNVSSFASEDHVLTRLEKRIQQLKTENPGLVVAKSGVPFHSYESSANAQQEIFWISGVSMLAILILLLYVFKTPLPIVATIGSLSVAIGTALCGTWLVFGNIHIFTFVFGTTVIGIGIDYSVHYWTHAAFSKGDARKQIFKSLTLGFATTALSYIALSVSPFPLLQQMAVFALIGLTSAYFTTNLVYPKLNRFTATGKKVPLLIPNLFSAFYAKLQSLPRVAQVAMFLAFFAALVPGFFKLDLHTDLRSLYKMSDELLESEKLSNRILDFGSAGFYFIVKGNSEQEVLETEELLTTKLTQEIADSSLKNFLATTLYITSQKSQRETFNIAKEKLAPNASAMLKNFGFENDSVFQKSMQKEPEYLSPESNLPKQWNELLSSLWLGRVDDSYYSVVLPLHVQNVDKINNLSNLSPNIYAVDKMGEINSTLTKLSQIALWLVLAAYLVIFVLLSFVYKPAGAFRVLRAPLLASLFTAAIFGYFNIPFNIFAVSGVILILGIGIDYALFFREGSKHAGITTLAVLVSAMTTVFSFGTLAFSNFNPVFTFGLAVFLGILGSLLFAPLSTRRENRV